MKIYVLRKRSLMPPTIIGGKPTEFYEPISAAEPWFTSVAQAVKARNSLARMLNNASVAIMSMEVRDEDGPEAGTGKSAPGVGEGKEAPGGYAG